MEINSVAIIGMGALGLLYAQKIVDASGIDSVSFIMDSDRYKKYQSEQFTINNNPYNFKLTDVKDATPVDLLIVAVKYNALPSVYPIIKKCSDDNTIVMSVLNGITSEKLIKENCGISNIIYTVAQGMDAMKFGQALTYTQYGELHIGVLPGESTSSLEAVCNYFDKVYMPYVKEDDILYRLWFKFMLNVGINQTCMIYEVGYGIATTPGTKAYMTMVSAMREVEVIALAEGIDLHEEDINKAIAILRTLSPDGTPSMGQDRIAKRKSEVDMFAGTVIELANKHQILVPTNEYIYSQVMAIEEKY